MPLSQASTPLGFDADAAVEAVRAELGDDLLVAVEFTDADNRTLYVADAVVEMYGGEAPMHEHFDEIHSDVHSTSRSGSCSRTSAAAGFVRW